ncbi:efflux transporter outer membrane subunit [Pseudomonas sp.]|uniref:efflux transporter outer membrane subunit n=1 Tax=Pseudomonas sp. TaxID=306 RepID=UPI003CC61759
MKAKRIILLASACSVLGLAGCTLGPDFQVPATPLGAHWQQPDASATRSRAVPGDVDSQWWRSFGDPQLTALLAEAQANNLDLRVAASHVEQSIAARATVTAGRLPSVAATADYSRARGSERGLTDISGKGGKANYNAWSTGLSFDWEADLWGRVRRSAEAADAAVQVSVEEQHAALVSIMAQVARDYIQLRGTQSSLDVTQQNLDIARHSLDLTRARLAQGVATDLEVAQAAALVASIEARVPPLEQQQNVLINALGFLLGRQPGALSAELSPGKAVPAGPTNVPVGLPSELAQRRPDIRRAEADLHAATAAIGIAQADFYPRISLSGNAGFQAMQLSNLGSWGSHAFAFGPSLSVPIFEGGRLQGQLQLRESRQQEAGIAYQRTVLAAWHEVDNALSGYQADQRRHQSLELAVSESQRALASAQQQYAQGSVDFLNVLTVQNALLANQAALVQSTADVSLTLVTLYQALGGGWQQSAQAALAVDDKQL